MDSYYAVVAPGLEPYTAREMEELGLLPSTEPDSSRHAGRGGVLFKGGRSELYRANLHLHSASRILARLGNFFRAETFLELENRASHLPWERFLHPGQPVSLRVTCHKSKLYHSDAVARTILKGISARLKAPSALVKAGDETADPLPQLIVVRLEADRCTVSVDSSGVPLHKRGYRQAVAKAPLRETLAAGMILASGWDESSPLLDPFCGSGTIPIEAAMMAGGILPGAKRCFTFMDWPDFDASLWQSLLGQSVQVNASMPLILASDRDSGAIGMARENALRAGVEAWVQFVQAAVSAITPPVSPGWVVTNPPYGERVSSGKDLRDLYARFGNVLREKCPGWNVAVLCSDPALLGQMQMDLDTSIRLMNGGIPVRLARGKVT